MRVAGGGRADDRVRASANPAGSKGQGVPGGRLGEAPCPPVDDNDDGRLGHRVTFGEQDGRTPVTIAQGGLPAARVRGEFAGGWASILDGLGRAVAARVTDRW